MSEQSGWRPIETAPKDGSLVLVWPREGRFPEIAWWVAPMRAIETEGYWTNGATDSYGDPEDPVEPTHWMPLPDPPTPEKEPSDAG